MSGSLCELIAFKVLLNPYAVAVVLIFAVACI